MAHFMSAAYLHISLVSVGVGTKEISFYKMFKLIHINV